LGGTESDKPLSHRIIENTLCKQLRKISIDEASRRKRNIAFHSLRHNLNASLRGDIDDATIYLIMGHVDPDSI
jgi:integrase